MSLLDFFFDIEQRVAASETLKTLRADLKTLRAQLDEEQNARQSLERELAKEQNARAQVERLLSEEEQARKTLEGELSEERQAREALAGRLDSLQQQESALTQALEDERKERQAFADSMDQRLKKTEQKEEAEVPPPPPHPPILPGIEAFILPDDETVLFPQSEERVRRAMAETLDLAAPRASLGGSKAAILQGIVDEYETHLRKAYEKLERRWDDIDDDERSQEVTEAFFSVLSDRLLKPFCAALYHGMEKEPEAYAQMIAAWNAYLSRCHVSTVSLRVGEKLSDVSKRCNVNVLPDHTDDAALYGTLKEIDRLPYCLHYLEDDTHESLELPGSAVVWAKR